MPDEGKVSIKFGGEAHSVNSTTFLNSLSSFITIVEEVNQEVNAQEKISIEINALEPGSFEILLDLVTSTYESAQIMFETGVSSVSDLVKIITGLYTLRKFLLGKKPEKVEETSDGIRVTNSNGDQTNVNSVVYNVYTTNFSVAEALNNNFEALNNDQSISDFTIKGDSPSYSFTADREDFPDLTDQDFEEIQEDEKIVRVRHSLRIFRVVFGKDYTWQFLLKGEKINAKVVDESFMDKLESGALRFGKGDVLEVELEILKKFDQSIGAFINKKYQVNKVIKHIPRASQSNFDFDS